MTLTRWMGLLAPLLCSLACPSERSALESAPPAELEGSSWQLTAYRAAQAGLVPVLDETTLTLRFESDGRVTGSAGCNRYFASYEIEGEVIRFGLPAATRMFCAAPEGLIDQEVSFLEALGAVARLRRSETGLELLDDSWQPVMRLIPLRE